MGRPCAAEPYLPRKLLSGESQRARSNMVPFQLTVISAYAQLAQTGSGLPVWDYSHQTDVQKFMNTVNIADTQYVKEEPKMPEAVEA